MQELRQATACHRDIVLLHEIHLSSLGPLGIIAIDPLDLIDIILQEELARHIFAHPHIHGHQDGLNRQVDHNDDQAVVLQPAVHKAHE